MDDEAKWAAVEEGMELLQEGRIDEAIGELTAAAEGQPENEYAHFFLGNAYFEQGEHAKALKCYVAALDAAPEYVGAMIGAGQSLRYLGDMDRALRMGRDGLNPRWYRYPPLFMYTLTYPLKFRHFLS